MWEGEYEGECLLPPDHAGPHDDGLSTWETDATGGTDWDSIDEVPTRGLNWATMTLKPPVSR